MKFILLHLSKETEDQEVMVNMDNIESMQHKNSLNYTRLELVGSVICVRESIAEIIELINA